MSSPSKAIAVPIPKHAQGKKPPPVNEGDDCGDSSDRITVLFASKTATVLGLGEWNMDQMLKEREHIACLDWHTERGGYRRSALSSSSGGSWISKAEWQHDIGSRYRRETKPGKIAFRRTLAILPTRSSHTEEHVLHLPHKPTASQASKDDAVARTVCKLCRLVGADGLPRRDRPYTSMTEPGREYGRLLVARGDLALRTPQFIKGRLPQIWYRWLPRQYREIVLENPEICGDPDKYPRP